MTQGLIIVDVQNDYFKGGSMELVGMDEAAASCRVLLDAFRADSAPLFHVQHLATREGATFFVPGTPGAEIHDSMTPAAGEPLVVKHYPSAFRDTGLHETLQQAGIDELVICGAMSHMCIDATTRAAADMGYDCIVAHDACATTDVEFGGRKVPADEVHAAFMSALGFAYAKVVPTKEALATCE